MENPLNQLSFSSSSSPTNSFFDERGLLLKSVNSQSLLPQGSLGKSKLPVFKPPSPPPIPTSLNKVKANQDLEQLYQTLKQELNDEYIDLDKRLNEGYLEIIKTISGGSITKNRNRNTKKRNTKKQIK